MIKKCFWALSFLTVLLFSCKKQETSDAKFTFTATLQSTNSVKLNWLAVNLAEFKNISIYRSTSPIPDPTFQTPIDGNLQVGLITDKTVTSFADSNFTVGSNGTVYYKIVVNLNNRFIVSEQEQVTFNAFSLVLSNTGQFGSTYQSVYLSERNFLYTVNFSTGVISLIDYTQKKITATANFSSNTFSSNTNLYATIDNGLPELFVVVNNSEIICYDGATLNQKSSIYPSYSVSDFKVKNGFIYIITTNGYLVTYNLSTQSLVNQMYILNNNYNNINNYGIYFSNYSNQLYVKYSGQTSMYQQSTNSYVSVYKNVMQAFNLANGIPLLPATNVNIAALNPDTLNYNNSTNAQYSHLSVDGKYMACNQQGDVYSFVTNTTHSLHTVNNSFPFLVFSNDGNYVLCRQNFNSLTVPPMDVFILPGFNLVTSLHSLNTGQFVFSSDFMDNDSLVSYNISQSFVNSQTSNTLTVLFKKID